MILDRKMRRLAIISAHSCANSVSIPVTFMYRNTTADSDSDNLPTREGRKSGPNGN